MTTTTTTTQPCIEKITDATRFADHLAVHHSIEGWFNVPSAATWDALMCMQEESGVVGHMLEIGVGRGKSAALMVRHAHPEHELCVLFDQYLDEDPVREALLKVRPELNESIQFMHFDSRRLPVDPLMASGYQSFRWIHLAGEKTAGALSNDLLVAHTLLGRDGIVCVDDFFNWLYPQVTEAVLRFVRENPEHFSLFLCGYNKAYLARPHTVHALQLLCRDDLPTALEARGIECTIAKTTYPAEMNTFGIGPRFNGDRLRGPDWEQHTIRV